MQAQHFLRGDIGRYWVALSLREAETVRGALHVAIDEGAGVVLGQRIPAQRLHHPIARERHAIARDSDRRGEGLHRRGRGAGGRTNHADGVGGGGRCEPGGAR